MNMKQEYDNIENLSSIIADESSFNSLVQFIGDFGLEVTSIDKPETLCPVAA